MLTVVGKACRLLITDGESKMFVTEAHSKAAAIANAKTIIKFGNAEFEIGSDKHKFWLEQYDIAFANCYK